MIPRVVGDISKRPGTTLVEAISLTAAEQDYFPLIIAPANGICHVFSKDDFSYVRSHDYPNNDTGGYTSCVAADGRYALAYNNTGGGEPILIFDTDGTPQNIDFDTSTVPSTYVSTMAFSDDGTYIYAACGAPVYINSDYVVKWNSTTGAVVETKTFNAGLRYFLESAFDVQNERHFTPNAGLSGARYGAETISSPTQEVSWIQHWASNRGKRVNATYVRGSNVWGMCYEEHTGSSPNNAGSFTIAVNDGFVVGDNIDNTGDHIEIDWNPTLSADSHKEAYYCIGTGSNMYVFGYDAQDTPRTNLRHYTIDSTTPLAITEQKRVWSDMDPAGLTANPTITGAVILDDGSLACFYGGTANDMGVIHWDSSLNLIDRYRGPADLGWPVLSLAGDNVQNGMVAVWYSANHESFSTSAGAGTVTDGVGLRLIPFVFNVDDAYVLGFGDNTLSFYRTVNNTSGRIQAP
jgi:hypothetical protein